MQGVLQRLWTNGESGPIISTGFTMDRDEFVEEAELTTSFTGRQAEAFYRRHIAGESRQTTAEAMETSPSNVDNLERAARKKIRQASNLAALLSEVRYGDIDLGTCAECGQLTTDPQSQSDTDQSLHERRMLCPDCAK